MKQKISFNEEVKNEICSLKYDKKYVYYFLISLFINMLQIKIINNKFSYVICSPYHKLIKLIKNAMLDVNDKFNSKITFVDDNINSNKKNIYLEFSDTAFFDKFFDITNFDYQSITNKQQKKYFILGAYLSHGSISFSYKKSSYHFEITSHNIEYIKNIKEMLENFNIVAKIIKRKNYHVLYFKKAEYISDLLKLFNVVDSLYKFEDFRIKKDFTNSLQRLNNLEVSNINKTINASLKQKENIILIKKYGLYDLLSEKEKLFCEIRLNEPEASLSEISNIFWTKHKIKISRTSLNHFIRKIANIISQHNI